MLPSDPVQAALISLAIGDLCRSLAFPVRLAGPPSSLRWIAECGAGIPIQTPDSKVSPREFAEWLEYNRAHRADWSLLATPRAFPIEEAVFYWLGGGGRIAAPNSCPRGSANILLTSDRNLSSLDTFLRNLVRVIRPQLPNLPTKKHSPQGPLVLELPDDLPEKGHLNRRWATAITELATAKPILLAHSDPLPTSIMNLLRSLGSRVAITHLANASETLKLAKHAGIWMGPRSPTTALASLAGCPVKLIGSPKSSWGFPENSTLTISGKIDWHESQESV